MNMSIFVPVLPRYSMAAAGGFAGALLLLWIMARLVDPGDVRWVETPSWNPIDRYEVRPDEPVITRDLKPQKPIVPEPEPTAPPALEFDASGIAAVEVAVPAIDAQRIQPRAGASDGQALPLVRVRPVYPESAARRRIEGYVVLAFAVSAQGTVADPQVIESVPAGVFDRAALRAVVKFKYRPRIVDGVAVPEPRVLHRVSFELADG